MWWLGLGILFFIWFIMNGDEFYYEGLKKGNMDVILLSGSKVKKCLEI